MVLHTFLLSPVWRWSRQGSCSKISPSQDPPSGFGTHKGNGRVLQVKCNKNSYYYHDCTFAGDHNILCLEKFSKRSYLCWNTCAGLSYHVHNLHDLMWWREPNLKAPAEILAWVGETLLLLSQRQGFSLPQSTTIVLSHQWTISRSFSISPQMIYLMLYEAAKTLWSLVDVNEPRTQ